MTESAGVSLRGIVKRFGAHEVIKGVDLDIDEGEFVVIVGPSGCGKSTLLRIIAGLEEASGGLVSIRGRDVTSVEPKDRDIAMVFQSYALYPHMTVEQNMSYGLRTRRVAAERIAELVGATSKLLQIGQLLARRPRQLSGGQRQRVAMGRAMVRQPHVYLFDEPLSNLDAKLRTEMRVELRRLHEQFRVTSVYVTHDQVEAMTLADRLVIMNNGTIEQIGRPIDLYLKPKTTYVAGFIGAPAMNFFPGTFSADAASVTLAGGGQAIALPGRAPDGWAGRPVTVGIRPEHLAVDGQGAGAGLRASVEMVERLGADTVLHCRFGGETLLARLGGVATATFGATADFVFERDNLHLFDPQTGERIELAGEHVH